MTDTEDTPIEPKDDDSPVTQSPGLMLRTRRENAGLSQQAVSEALHLTVHYIKSLENDEYGKLPGLTFVKGYFRSYSRFLGMNVDEVLACYEDYLATKGLQMESSDFVPSHRRGRSDQSLAWAVMAGTILIIALAAGWWFFGRELEARRAATPAAASPTPQTPAPIPERTDIAVTATTATVTPATTDVAGEVQLHNGTADAALEPADAGAAIINATLEARQEAEAEALAAEQAVFTGDTADAVNGAVDAVDSATVVINDAADVADTDAAVDAAQTDTLQYVTSEDGRRVITHRGPGDDRLELNLNGNSWAEVKNAQGTNLFNNMLRQGDQLVIQGEAPLAVLLGDARQVQASFNAQRVDLSTLIRNDNTARFELGPSGVSTSAFTSSQASATE